MNSTKEAKLKVVLFAPEKAVSGGIAMWTKRLKIYINYDKINLRIIDTSKLFDPLGKELGIYGAVLGFWGMLRNFCLLLRALLSFRPDIVFFTCSPSIGYLVRDITYMHLLRLLRIPYAVHFRGGQMGYFFGRNYLEKVLVHSALKSATGLITISRFVEKRARELFDSSKVFYLPNMIEDSLVERIPEKVTRDERPLKLIHVAWQARAKGTFDIINALAMTKCSVMCELIGEVADENRNLIEREIKDKKLSDKIALTGMLKGQALEDKYLGADMFIFPSHSEGFPNAIMEAMAYGMPIIATDVGNIREMVNADSEDPAGIVLDNVNPVNPEELAKYIDMLANDVELRMRMSANGQKRVKEQYVASRVVPQLEELLFTLCQGRAR